METKARSWTKGHATAGMQHTPNLGQMRCHQREEPLPIPTLGYSTRSNSITAPILLTTRYCK